MEKNLIRFFIAAMIGFVASEIIIRPILNPKLIRIGSGTLLTESQFKDYSEWTNRIATNPFKLPFEPGVRYELGTGSNRITVLIPLEEGK